MDVELSWSQFTFRVSDLGKRPFADGTEGGERCVLRGGGALVGRDLQTGAGSDPSHVKDLSHPPVQRPGVTLCSAGDARLQWYPCGSTEAACAG